MDKGQLTKVPLQHNDTDIMLNSGCRNWKRTTTFTAVELWPAAAAARTAVCLSNTIVSEATSVRNTVPLTTFYSAADCESHKGMSNAIIWFSWPSSWEKYCFFHFLFLCIFFFCFPFFCIRGQFGDKHEGGCVFARWAFLNRCILLLPRVETSNRRWMQKREITAQPGECYLLQVITQLSVNTVAGDTMPRREVEDTQTAEWFASTPERSQRRGRTCEGKGKCRNTVREKAHVCFSW